MGSESGVVLRWDQEGEGYRKWDQSVVLRWDQEGEGYRKWVSMKWV